MQPDNAGCVGALVKMDGKDSGVGGTVVYFTCADCAMESSRAVENGGRDKHGGKTWGPAKPGTGQISMPGNTAQMGYDYLGQMTSRNVMLTATLFRPIRSLFLMTLARGSLTPTLF